MLNKEVNIPPGHFVSRLPPMFPIYLKTCITYKSSNILMLFKVNKTKKVYL